MIEFLPHISTLPIGDVQQVSRLRPVSEAAVAVLAQVIGEYGFTVPILVRKKRDGFVLIDGAHRLTAMTQIGAAEIPVRAMTCTDEEARALEASQNLAGASMSPLDDAIFMAAYGEAYQKLHPETRAGSAGAFAKHGSANDTMSFAEIIAEKRAISLRHVQRMAAAGRSISPEDANALRRASKPVTLKDLQILAKAKPDARAAIVDGLSYGEAKSAADALKRHLQTTGQALVKRDLDPVEAAFKALREAWSRAPKAAKRRFVEEHFPEMERLAHDLVAEGWDADGDANELSSVADAPADASEIAAQ